MTQRLDYIEDEATCVDESTYRNLIACLSSVSHRRLLYGEWLPNVCEDCSTTTDVLTWFDTTRNEKQCIYLCRTCHEIHPHRKQLKLWGFEKDSASWMKRG